MAKINLVFLSYTYPPHKYPRAIQVSHLVEGISDEFNLRVLTSKPGQGQDNSLLTFTSMKNVVYAEKSTITQLVETLRGERIKKALLPDYSYLWHFDLYHKAKDFMRSSPVDVIMTFGQPMSTHIVGLKLKRKYPHLKWLAHFSDPWVDNIFNDYNRWLKFTNQHYQDAVFKSADRLIFTSDETIKLAIDNSDVDLISKTLCIPHSFNQALFQQAGRKRASKKTLTMRFLGNFYGNRQPEPLFRALKNISNAELASLRVELIGSATTEVEERIKYYGLEAIVKQYPSVSYIDSLRLMQQADLLLIIDAPTELSPFLPSKLIDYIGANKPIFGMTPAGTSQRLINEMGYLTAHPENTTEAAKKLSLMMRRIKDGSMAAIPENIRSRFSTQTVSQTISHCIRTTFSTAY